MRWLLLFVLVAGVFAAGPELVMHKQITPTTADVVQVKLTLENNGELPVENLIVVDFVGNGIISSVKPATVKEINTLKWAVDQLPQKTKRIFQYSMKGGEEEVYPQVLGVDPSTTYLTLSRTEIIQEELRIFQEGEEFIIPIALAIIIVMFLLVVKHKKYAKI